MNPHEYSNQHLLSEIAALQESSDPWLRCRGQFLQECHMRSGSWATVRSYMVHLQVFFTRNPLPDAITREDVFSFLQAPCGHGPRQGLPPSVSTRNARLSAVSGLYEFAQAFTITGQDGQPAPLFDRANPTANIPYGKVARPYHVLTEGELERLLSVIDRSTVIGKRDYAIVLTFALSSRRNQEILRLRAGDIQPATFEKDGTTRQGWTFAFRGKGESRFEDHAELPEPAKAAIDEWLLASGRMPLAPDDFVFVATQAAQNRPIGRSAIGHRLKCYAELAGLDEHLSSHWLRHSSARLRVEAGEDIRSIQRVLRHKSLATTDIYLRQLSTAADAGADKLTQRFAFLAK